MASLQARHARSCPLAPWTPAARATKEHGCTCAPVFYVAARVRGKLVRDRIGKNRREAERALNRIAHEVDEGRYVAPRALRFDEWAAEWRAGLSRPKPTTIYSYLSTVQHANRAFGYKLLRDIDQGDIVRLYRHLDEQGLSASTQAKHSRVLHAVFKEAVNRRLIAHNPVALISATHKPQPVRHEAAYFDDDELPRLAAELSGVYLAAFRLCIGTGLRLGEALGLTWADIDWTENIVNVRRTMTMRSRADGPPVPGTTTPKSNQVRQVYTTADVLEPLARWWRELGEPADETLVLPGPDGYMRPDALLRQLRAAMRRAGVPVVHSRTGTSRNWHSTRHTHARLALQAGASLSSLQEQLGHSSPLVTARYSHWAHEARRRQAELTAGVFAL